MHISFVKKKVVLPRVLVGKTKSRPGYASVGKGDTIINPQDTFLEESIQSLRARNQVIPALRKLAEEDGNFSSAVFSLVQIANSGYKVQAFDTGTHSFNQEGTEAVMSVIAAMDTLYDYTKRYRDKPSMKSVIETLLRETALTSGCGVELVLDALRFPDRIQPVNYGSLEWVSDGSGGRYPQQKNPEGGDPIDLNISTFWVGELHKETDKAYATPMMKAALATIYHYKEFIEEMRRVIRKAGHGRLVVTLDAEKVRDSAPDDIKKDSVKLSSYMSKVQTDVETALADLEPEDSVVGYDSVEFKTHNPVGSKADYSPMIKQLSGMAATSMKTPTSILGMRMEGSQSLSNTESLVYLKTATSIQGPVEQVLSRALTLATRLLGRDVYIKFTFKPINLRPDDELEAFKTMKQNNVLGLLSLGMYSDEQAYNELGIPFREEAEPLSGTRFHDSGRQEEAAGNPTANSDPMGRALQPDNEIPRKGGGRDQ